MRTKQRFLLYATCLVSTLAVDNVCAQSVELELNDKTVRLQVAGAVWGQQHGRLELEGGYLYSDNDNDVLHLGMHVYNDVVDSPLSFGLGARLYWADADGFDAGALAVGGKIHYAPPALRGVGFGANVYYSPTVTTFSDAETFTEWNVLVDYQLMPQAALYLGYRDIRAEIEDAGWVDVEDGGYLGVQFRF